MTFVYKNTESELFSKASFSLNFGFEGILPTPQFQLDLGSDPSKIFPRHTYHVDTDDRINRKGRSIIFCHNLSHYIKIFSRYWQRVKCEK